LIHGEGAAGAAGEAVLTGALASMPRRHGFEGAAGEADRRGAI
jgi:hypothetical protein